MNLGTNPHLGANVPDRVALADRSHTAWARIPAESIDYTSAARVARSVVRSAVAEEHGDVVLLAALSTLCFTVPDVHADIADLGHGIDGVLGMNFLGDFNFEIRPAEQRILVERIASS